MNSARLSSNKVQSVVRCDECNRVVADVKDDGSFVVRGRHDGHNHRTIIKPEDIHSDKC